LENSIRSSGSNTTRKSILTEGGIRAEPESLRANHSREARSPSVGDPFLHRVDKQERDEIHACRLIGLSPCHFDLNVSFPPSNYLSPEP